jgi:hypothetical protein
MTYLSEECDGFLIKDVRVANVAVDNIIKLEFVLTGLNCLECNKVSNLTPNIHTHKYTFSIISALAGSSPSTAYSASLTFGFIVSFVSVLLGSIIST